MATTAQSAASGALEVLSLRGGMNDTDPANNLADDQCTLAQNVEFFYSMLGERRAGVLLEIAAREDHRRPDADPPAAHAAKSELRDANYARLYLA